MAAAPVTIEMDKGKDDKLVRWLRQLSRAGPAAVANALNEMVADWQREIVRRAPVDTGLYRQSIQTVRATATNTQAAVGTNVPYAIELEYNPKGHIAKGKVKAWQPGNPVITDWPAKSRRGAEARDKKTGQFKKGSGGGGRAQIMPPFRGSWQIIAGKMSKKLQARVRRVLKIPT